MYRASCIQTQINDPFVASLDKEHRESCFDTTPENAFQLKCRGLQVSHLNACSVLRKMDELKYILSESSIDIMCLTVTHLSTNIYNEEIVIPNYSIVRHDRSFAPMVVF